jgi:hypothetical protein
LDGDIRLGERAAVRGNIHIDEEPDRVRSLSQGAGPSTRKSRGGSAPLTGFQEHPEQAADGEAHRENDAEGRS